LNNLSKFVPIVCVISSSMLTTLTGGLFIGSCHSFGISPFYFMFFGIKI
jgi:hypothetical protein